ncbi:MAG: hypothetical protein SOY73_14935 [Blautia sp.]|nr:hypothetical protein [Blautia sp.]
MSSSFKILEDKKLSRDEFIADIQKEKWKHYYYQHDIESPNPNAQFVLARGQFEFDSIEFNTDCGDAIRLYNRKNPDDHFLNIGYKNIAYVHKEKVLSNTFNLISTSYIVHFIGTDKIISFGASKE